MVRTEQPVTCVDSESEPGLAVVRGQKDDFRQLHLRTAELVIEVCVTSIEYVRSKIRACASAGVKECWLVLQPQRKLRSFFVRMESDSMGAAFTVQAGHSLALPFRALP